MAATRKRKPKVSKDDALPIIYDALAQGATVAHACQKAKCSERAFYLWQEEDVQVMQAVTRAREAYASTVDVEVQQAAGERLLDLLRNGETITQTKIIEEPNGEGFVVTKRETVTRQRGTPKWVFDKLMPDSLQDALPGAVAGQAVQVNVHTG